ncbi:unnamed protein product, partial [Rotaria sp. Silwood1]
SRPINVDIQKMINNQQQITNINDLTLINNSNCLSTNQVEQSVLDSSVVSSTANSDS